jgi:hypothetical protein
MNRLFLAAAALALAGCGRSDLSQTVPCSDCSDQLPAAPQTQVREGPGQPFIPLTQVSGATLGRARWGRTGPTTQWPWSPPMAT